MFKDQMRRPADDDVPNNLPAQHKIDPDTKSSNVMNICMSWMFLSFELDFLVQKGQKIERTLIEDHRWFAMTTQQQNAFPAAAELHEINRRFGEIDRSRALLLRRLVRLPATDTHTAVAKLDVAARIITHDIEPNALALIVDATRALKSSG